MDSLDQQELDFIEVTLSLLSINVFLGDSKDIVKEHLIKVLEFGKIRGQLEELRRINGCKL